MKAKIVAAVSVLVVIVAGVASYVLKHEDAPLLAESTPLATTQNTPNVAATTTANTGEPAQPIAAAQQQLAQLANCEQTQRCPQGKDAYEGEYERHRQMAALLAQLAKDALQRPSEEDNYRKIASDYLSWPDGHVQSAALSLLSALPTQPANVKLITTALQENFDAPLMRQAMQELQRYPANNNELQTFFGHILQTGAMYASQEVAQGLLPFLTADNVAYYQQILTELDHQSKKAQLLQATLDEFGMQQSQG